MGNLYDKYTAVDGGGKTLTALKNICRYEGWNDSTTNGQTALTNFINETLQILAMLAPWPEYLHRDGSVTYPTKAHTISSIVDDDAGAVDVTTSAVHGLTVGDIVTVTGTTEYNESAKTITEVGSTTTLAYASSVDKAEETTGAITRDDNNYEVLSSTRFLRMGTVVRDDYSVPLDEIAMDEWLHKTKYNAATGPPNEYALRKTVSSGDIAAEMVVYPEPVAAVTLYYTWQSSPLILSADSDTTDWPDVRLWLLTDSLRIRLAEIDRDSSGVVLYSSDFMTKVNRAYNQARPSYKPIIAKSPTFRPWGTPLQYIEKTFV